MKKSPYDMIIIFFSIFFLLIFISCIPQMILTSENFYYFIIRRNFDYSTTHDKYISEIVDRKFFVLMKNRDENINGRFSAYSYISEKEKNNIENNIKNIIDEKKYIVKETKFNRNFLPNNSILKAEYSFFAGKNILWININNDINYDIGIFESNQKYLLFIKKQ